MTDKLKRLFGKDMWEEFGYSKFGLLHKPGNTQFVVHTIFSFSAAGRRIILH